MSYWKELNDNPDKFGVLVPSLSDVNVFEDNLMAGTTLLLGCTKRLISISTKQMDIDPLYDLPTVIKQDWLTNKVWYNNIICDGSLNFTEELASKIILMASKNCSRFISRTFTRKLDIMRVAAYFPDTKDLVITPSYRIRHPDYSFYIWDF